MIAAPIALMTDFGLRDPFVGIMKGVILGINPSALIVDVSHEIAPGDIRGAAFALDMAFPYFPADTIFAVVVDPGVGTERRGVAARIGERTVVCPDNGLLTWVLRNRGLTSAVELAKREYFLPKVSDTFHGRDVFAPVAAHLSTGVRLEDLGPRIEDLTTFEIAEVVIADRSIQGEIVYVDRFGNLISNIAREQFDDWRPSADGVSVRVHIGSAEIQGISRTYSDAPRGHAAAVFGSAGFLEIATNGGSAAESFGASVGSRVSVYQLPG